MIAKVPAPILTKYYVEEKRIGNMALFLLKETKPIINIDGQKVEAVFAGMACIDGKVTHWVNPGGLEINLGPDFIGPEKERNKAIDIMGDGYSLVAREKKDIPVYIEEITKEGIPEAMQQFVTPLREYYKEITGRTGPDGAEIKM